MFIREDNSTFSFSNVGQLDIPEYMEFVDCSLQPIQRNDYMSGSYLIAMFYNTVKFRNTANPVYLSDADILSKIYNPSKIYENALITLSKGIQACSTNLFGLPASNVIYFNTQNSIKRYLHMYHAIIVEMSLSTSITTQTGTFDISTAGTLISEASSCTKGFLAIGYDSTGLVVQNTLGRKYGSLGFARISWNVVNSLLVKGVAIKNIFN